MDDIVELAGRYGMAAVFFTVLLESLGLPVPAMPLLAVAAAYAAADQLGLARIIALSVLACVMGELLWYVAGQRYGSRVLRTLCRISLSPDSCVRQTEEVFGRWGAVTLVFAKFVPGLATIAPPLAGSMNVALGRFLGLAALGALLWSATAVALGAIFHDEIIALLGSFLHRGTQALELIGSLLAVVIGFKWWERRRFLRALRIARIDAGKLEALRQEGANPVILDVRSRTARELDPRRIPGARHVDIDDAAPHLEGIDRGTPVIVYCNCPNEASAARVALTLSRQGFRRVHPLLGGLDAWVEAGYDVEAWSASDLSPLLQSKAR